MCLAVPVRVVSLLGDGRAVVDAGGVHTEISMALVQGIQPGEYVIVHVGFALARLDPVEAERTLRILAEGGVRTVEKGEEDAIHPGIP
jgi:hydrogenase expression/formation protein HypC